MTVERNSIGDLVAAENEAEVLSRKESPTAQQQNRLNFLLQRISLLKQGIPADTLFRADISRKHFPQELAPHYLRPGLHDPEKRREIRAIQAAMLGKPEERVEGVAPVVYANLNGSLGSFVPLEFVGRLIRALKQHSPLWDADKATVIYTDHGRPMQTPWISDIENVASVIGENSQDADQDISFVGGKNVQVYSYRTPRVKLALETLNDLDASFGAVTMLEEVMRDRLARGAGADLMLGSGVNKPLGLIPSLQALGSNPIVIAIGSAANTGGSETGANSVGSKDLRNLLYAVPAPYRSSSKFGFVMNSNTAAYIAGLLDKSGRPFIDLNEGAARLLGKNVWFDESMDNIGASKFPVLAGDLSYWVTRIAVNTMYLKVYRQAQNLIEQGLFAVRLFARVGGVLAHSDLGAPSPIWLLQNHS